MWNPSINDNLNNTFGIASLNVGTIYLSAQQILFRNSEWRIFYGLSWNYCNQNPCSMSALMGPKLIIHNTLDFPQNKQHKVHILAHICVPACSRVCVCILGLGPRVCMYRSASVGLEQIFPLCVRKM